MRGSGRGLGRSPRGVVTMALAVAVAVAAGLLVGEVTVGAHRLDEYLQAARVSVAPNRLDVDWELGPGVAVAERVRQMLDRDGDGRVSEAEADAYARRVVGEVRVEIDYQPRKLKVLGVHLPKGADWTNGSGVIQLSAGLRFPALAAGAHVLTLTNRHELAMSVYQVNALVPVSPVVRLGRQSRDELQQGYRLEFTVLARIGALRLLRGRCG